MASDPDTGPAVSPQAKAWIDALCSGRGACGAWRLELLDQRSRRLPESSGSDSDSGSDSGSGAPRMKLLPMRIRRSVPGLPRSLVDSAVRYLVSLAPYSGIIYEGEEIPGEWWPARTMWRMDQGMNGRDGTYTLVQDLVPSQADALDGVAVADSCSSVATTDWHWEELDVEDVSGRSSQGVTVAVQAVSRNEDGTLDYSVVTRTALTQDSGWYVSKCDAFSRVERRVWDNVYGDPPRADGGGRGPLQSGGVPFPAGDEPPEPCSFRDLLTGATCEVQWRENEDCTWRVEAERTFPVIDVSDAQTGERRTLTGVTATTVARNLPREEAEALVDRLLRGSDSEIGIGDSYEIRKNDSGLYDVEVSDTRPASIGALAASATANAFRREAERRENVDMADAVAELGIDPSDPGTQTVADRPRDGVVRTVEARVTETGTVDVTRRWTYDLSDSDAQRGERRTLNGVTTTTLARNLTYAAAMRLVDELKGADDELGIGDSYELRKTDSGLYDVERVDTRAASIGATGASATANFFRREAETRTNVDRSDAEDILGLDLSDSGYAFVEPVEPGRVRTVEARVTETGTVDVTRRSVRDLRNDDAQRGSRRTLTSVTTTTLARNLTQADADEMVRRLAGRSDSDLDVGESYEVRKTESGLYDVELVRNDVQVPPGLSAWEVSSTPIVVRAAATRHVTDGSRPLPSVWDGAQGTGPSLSVVGPGGKPGWWMDKTSGSFHVTWADRGHRVSETATRNEDGSWRHEIAEEVEKSESDAYFSQVLLSPLSIVYLRWYARVSAATLKAKVAALKAELEKFNYSTSSMGHAPTSIVPSLEVSEDQYGLLNAKLTLSVHWPPGSYGTQGWDVTSDGDGVKAPAQDSEGNYLFADEDAEPYFVLRFADTMIAAGRGIKTLRAFMERRYETNAYGTTGYASGGADQFADTEGNTVGSAFAGYLDDYARLLSRVSGLLASLFGLSTNIKQRHRYVDPSDGKVKWSVPSPRTVPLEIPVENIQAGVMYSVDRVNASLDASTGQWTASYVFANVYANLPRIRDMLGYLLDGYIGLAQVDSMTSLSSVVAAHAEDVVRGNGTLDRDSSDNYTYTPGPGGG